MKIKRILLLITGSIILFILSSCKVDLDNYVTKEDTNFCYKTNEDGTISLGSVNNDYSSSIVFAPYEIEGMIVRKLGYDSGLGFGGYGYLHQSMKATDEYSGYNLKKFYAPASINELNQGYLKYANNLQVFYCGEVLNLNILAGRDIAFYVPDEYYDNFYNTIDDKNKEILYKANVSYNLNYENEYKYYYVDNCNYDSMIENIPPDPIREGYTFGGWFTETECLNQWIFDINELPTLNDGEWYMETKLYAKWD